MELDEYLNIESNASDIKNKTFGDKISKIADGYRKGAIVFGSIGILVGWYFRGNIIYYGLAGVVIGGYIGDIVQSNSDPKVEFINFSNVKKKKTWNKK